MTTTARPFVTDAALTAIAVNYRNAAEMLIADQVLPRVAVPTELYKYDYFPPDEIFTLTDDTVGRRGQVPQVDFSGEQRTGQVFDHGLEADIPMSDIDAASAQRAQGNSGYDPEARAIEGLTHKVRLNRERRAAALVMDPNNYDADKRVTLAGGDRWNDYGNSDPLGDMLSGMDQTFIERPNVVVIPRITWTVTRRHPKLVKAAQGNDGDSGAITRQQLADLLEVDEVIIADGFQNENRKGQEANYTRIWGTGVAMIHRAPITSTQAGEATFGITAEWRRFGGSAMMAGRYGDPKSGGLMGGIAVRVGEAVGEKLIAPSTGYFINSPIG